MCQDEIMEPIVESVDSHFEVKAIASAWLDSLDPMERIGTMLDIQHFMVRAYGQAPMSSTMLAAALTVYLRSACGFEQFAAARGITL